MTKKMLSMAFAAAALMALPTAAGAVTIGANQLLGIVEPGTPADADNEAVMINGLLNGWTDGSTTVVGYNGGAASGTVMGNNPLDAQNETYTLKYSASTVIPDDPNAPSASTPGYRTVTSNATFNLGNFTYKWVVAKWGPDSAVYYIGNLAANTEVTLSLGGTGWTSQGHGLSHYTLFNRTPGSTNGGGNGGGDRVPDGGTTSMLLGSALVGVAALRRRLSL
ncbi:hypothetical protein TBR22_A52910 [Luteitalea sp. TBR-22]|uniref:VPDSG-CTERM sorting domain-containing protein n=1 Tax=Luteitalea sp. TBR-22 TaxID=2802971 RepID=UPI001AF10BB2|nr:VPDSG-CTERM sorting domain-containing protein [Luteitalea sp. TBR-22]BCS36054.1 hypothetical protein TBR22_A52910 [Luteitalea sp. TBR-22]